MATYVNDLRLKEIGTGESSGTWGTETNVNLELIGEAMGYGTEAITTNADTHASTVADGSTDAARSMYIKYTGTLDSACTITIGPNTMSRVHIIENATSGSQNIIIKQGSGAEVTIPNGFVKAVYLDGAGSGAAVTEAFTDLSVGGNLLIDGTTPKLTIGDGGAEDTAIVFDGNAQDFYIGLDDSADDLIIGLGSTVGTTPIISVDENKDVAIPDGGLTITTSDNTTQLTLKSTDADANTGPVLNLQRDSGSPADNDYIGNIKLQADNDAGEVLDHVSILGQIVDASDGTEDAKLSTYVLTAGTVRNALEINPTEIVINEDSIDRNFRVESDANTHAIYLDAGTDKLGIGVSSPIARLSLPAQATGDSGIARIAIESAVDDNDFMISQYEDSSGTYTLIGQNLGLNSGGSDTILDGGHRTAAIRLDARGSGTIQFLTGNTNANAEVMRIDKTGNVGIGVTSITHALEINRSSSSAAYAVVGNGGNVQSYIGVAGDNLPVLGSLTNHDLRLVTNATERMRITTAGVLSIGDATPENGAFETTKCLFLQGNESVQTIKNTSASDTSQRVAIGFLNSSGTGVGYISNNSSSTVFGTSSDYRLKENVTYDWDALTRLKQLKPARFNWIVDDTNTLVDGFLAHEAQTVVPEAVTGTHNETKDLTNVVLNEFGNVIAKGVTEDDWKAGKEGKQPQYAANTTWKAEHTQDIYQGIDQSKLVPLMVKAIQEQQTLIETLEAKVKKLEEA